MKLGVVVVTHGQLATELVNSAEIIVGDLPHFTAVSIGWHDDVDHAKEEIGRAIARVQSSAGGTADDPAGVLVLTDMFGGTPTNIAAMFLKENEVEIVTGVNLPMVIKLASMNRDITLRELAREVEDQGKESICQAGQLLEPQKMRKDA